MTHVHHDRLTGSGDLTELARHVSRLTSAPLARDRPLWQIHIIDGFDGGTALVARMHHCIADGVALFRVLLALSDEAQDGRLGAPVPRTAAVLRLEPPSRSARGRAVAVAGLRGARSALALIGMLPDRRTTLRAALGTTKSVRWSAPLPLHAVKAAARAADATVNDVVLAALSGALHRHLVAAGGDPATSVQCSR